MTLHVSSSDKAQRRCRRGKKQKIYLKEPHDYFGVNYYVRQMQQQQQQKGPEGSLLSVSSDFSDYSKSAALPSQHWRAFDLHNKPRGLYSEEDKRIAAALEYQNSPSNPPYSPDLSTKFKGLFGVSSTRNLKFKMEAEPLMGSHFRPRFNSYSTCCSSEVSSYARSRTVSESSSSTTDSWKKQVHFSPETVFCERDFKSPFWTKMAEKRRLQAEERAEREDNMLGPRPFLPYLESGLSYHDKEEFYRLKNNLDHRNAQLELMRQENFRGSNKEGSSSFHRVLSNVVKVFSCCYGEDVVYKAKGVTEEGSFASGPYRKKRKWI